MSLRAELVIGVEFGVFTYPYELWRFGVRGSRSQEYIIIIIIVAYRDLE